MTIKIINLSEVDALQSLSRNESSRVIGGFYRRNSCRRSTRNAIQVTSTPTSNTYSTANGIITATPDGITARGIGHPVKIGRDTSLTHAFGNVATNGTDSTAIAGGTSSRGHLRGLACQCKGIVCSCKAF
jgi:hypothetical protein